MLSVKHSLVPAKFRVMRQSHAFFETCLRIIRKLMNVGDDEHIVLFVDELGIWMKICQWVPIPVSCPC